ncbi:MAG TPA: homocitrate synthase [Candidatus Thermoplasmatota archaeon]|nr:homocitrate synthase [Candidatus Thermoplasmatota archaeon]
MVKLLDSTLREGEQTAGVTFTVEQKVEIARALDAFGVEYIEAGHPAVSPDVLEGVRAVAREGLHAEIVAHSRALRKDIDLVLQTDADWVGIFFSVADARLEEHFRKNEDEAVALIQDSVAYAKSRGLKVRYTPEDTVRSRFETVVRVSRAAAEAGADRISVADTTGYVDPFGMFDFVHRLRAAVPRTAALGVHCHNDLGMAVANSLAAVRAGAEVVDVCVNGLGERAGIAPLAETAVALRLVQRAENAWRLDGLPGLSRLVEERAAVPLSPLAPIVGRNAFTHNAGLHVAAVLLNPAHYESIPASLVGRERRLVVDKMAGRPTVRHRLRGLGLAPTDEACDAVLALVKARDVNDADDAQLLALYAEAQGTPAMARTVAR